MSQVVGGVALDSLSAVTKYLDTEVNLILADHWDYKMPDGTPAGSLGMVLEENPTSTAHHFQIILRQVWNEIADMCVDQIQSFGDDSDPVGPRYTWSDPVYNNLYFVGTYRYINSHTIQK